MTLPLLLVVLAAPLSLRDAVQRAVDNDPGLRAAGLRVEEAAASETAARGAFDLVVGANASASQLRQLFDSAQLPEETSLDTDVADLEALVSQPLVWGTQLRLSWLTRRRASDQLTQDCFIGEPFSECLVTEHQWRSELRFELRQPLLRDFGRRVNEARVADARASGLVAQASQVAQASGVVARVVSDYVELAHTRASAGIRKQALDLAQEQLDATRARIAAGTLADVDLPVVEQAVAERRQALFAAEQAAADRAGALVILAALDGPPHVSLPEPDAFETPLKMVLEAAESKHPDLATLDAEIARQEAGLVVRENATRPQLDLTAIASQGGVDNDVGPSLGALPDDEDHLYLARLSFSFPFANRAAEGALAAARIAVRRAREERAARLREIQLDAGEAFRGIRTAEGNLELAQTVVTLSQKSLEAERRKFDHGRATNLDVLRVQQALAEARLGLARARADRLLAITRLQRLTGALLTRYGLVFQAPGTP